MAQKAEHHYDRDFGSSYGAENQSKWIWGVLGALALLALIVWFASAGGPTSTNLSVSEQPAAPAADTTATGSTDPAAQPAAPAAQPAPAQPAQ